MVSTGAIPTEPYLPRWAVFAPLDTHDACLFGHDLFRKPLHTFRDHALANCIFANLHFMIDAGDIEIGVVMRRLVPWAFVLFVFAQFGGWVSVSEAVAAPQPRSKAAAEPQSKPQAPRLARLYFLREKGMWGTEVGIKIDGQPVGSVSKGFYFAVSKPPGRYRITCVNPISMDYEAEVQIEGGQTYYFGIGVPQHYAPGQNLLNQALAGSSGRQLQATSPLASGFSGAALYQIDAAEGPAVISQLKPK